MGAGVVLGGESEVGTTPKSFPKSEIASDSLQAIGRKCERPPCIRCPTGKKCNVGGSVGESVQYPGLLQSGHGRTLQFHDEQSSRIEKGGHYGCGLCGGNGTWNNLEGESARIIGKPTPTLPI